MRTAATYLLAVMAALLLSGCATIATHPSPDYSTLVWSDEFDGATVDSTKWTLETGYGANESGWGNDEWQLYTDSEDNAYLEDGKLVISVECTSANCAKRDGTVTSARLKSEGKFSFKYGRVQARIKPPKGIGTWAAFWMLGDSFKDEGWPRCGEIDIMEMHYKYSDPKTVNAAAHWWDDALDKENKWTYTYGHRAFEQPLGDDFHIFEVEWTPQGTTAKIDGEPYYTQAIDAATMGEFQEKFFLIMNVAVGGNLGGDVPPETRWPQKMYVDWVRVYQ
jgi:beta-glucanase (GH16 family)